MGRTSEAMRKKVLERYRRTPNCKKVADELGLNEKTVAKYVKLDEASASEERQEPAATAPAVSKENTFSRTIKLLESGRPMVEIVAELGLAPDEATKYFEHYARIKNLDFLLQTSKNDPDSVDETAELLRLLQKEGFSPSNCVQEIKLLGLLKASRDELGRLNAKVEEGRAASKSIARENKCASEELSKTGLVLAYTRGDLAAIEARWEKAKKECASVETLCREANVNLMKLQSSTQTLQRNEAEIMRQARSEAIREARAVLSNDPRIAKISIGALVKCAYTNPSILFT